MTDSTANLDLDAIRRLTNRATGGNWTLRERQSNGRRVLAVISEGEGEMTYVDVAEVPMEPGDDLNDWRNDAEFIAKSRSLLPRMAAEVDRLRAELAEAKAKLDADCGSCHPCTNWADQTWRNANRRPPHVTVWDATRNALLRTRNLADDYETAGDVETAQRIRQALHIPDLHELLAAAEQTPTTEQVTA